MCLIVDIKGPRCSPREAGRSDPFQHQQNCKKLLFVTVKNHIYLLYLPLLNCRVVPMPLNRQPTLFHFLWMQREVLRPQDAMNPVTSPSSQKFKTASIHMTFDWNKTKFLKPVVLFFITHPSQYLGFKILDTSHPLFFYHGFLTSKWSLKNYKTKSRTHSFGDTALLCTISVTSGFKFN